MQDILQPVGVSDLERNRRAVAAYSAAFLGSPAEEYIAGRGLPAWVPAVAKLGYVSEPLEGDEKFQGMLAIPYLTSTGQVTAMRYRALGDVKPKYNQPAGQRTLLYQGHEVANADQAHVTEGEIDCLSLTAAGFKACGVPGANAWKNYYPVVMEGARRVFVWADPDDAGDNLWERIVGDLPHAVRVPVPQGMDVNALLVERGVEGLRAIVDGLSR